MYVLSELAGASATTAALAGLVLIAFAAWLSNAAGQSEGGWRGGGFGLSTLAAGGAFALLLVVDVGGETGTPSPGAQTAQREGIAWQPFSEADFEALRSAGKPIFIDFTAAWCITCKVNERIALADPAVAGAFASRGIAALRADWTRQDAGITRILAANGRAGVPLYLFYPKPAPTGEHKPPVILPQLLTAASILREVQEN
jgi:thiol:disulfide interchange protein DsbD